MPACYLTSFTCLLSTHTQKIDGFDHAFAVVNDIKLGKNRNNNNASVSCLAHISENSRLRTSLRFRRRRSKAISISISKRACRRTDSKL